MAMEAWSAIERMPNAEWLDIVDYVLIGLRRSIAAAPLMQVQPSEALSPVPSDVVELLRRLKRDLMHARRFSSDTLATYRRACSSAEGDIEEFLATLKPSQPSLGQAVADTTGGAS